jgi:hypothetical protein
MKKLLSYATPVLLGVLMFASNFLNTKLFNFGDNAFAVWFVLSVLCFATGWYILKTLGWRLGGKVIFAVIISVTFISIIMISLFMEYFSTREILTENLILYSLRNITLGAMAFFGMAVPEILALQKDIFVLEEKLKVFEEVVKDAKKEAELELKGAKIKAEKIINDAEQAAKNTFLKKERIESELKEFIQVERELIKKYEQL